MPSPPQSIARTFSRTQAELAADIVDGDGRNYLALGPIRSGKSYAALLGWLVWAMLGYHDRDFLLGARSAKQLNAVCIQRGTKPFARATGLDWIPRKDHWEMGIGRGRINRFWPTLGGKGQEELIEGITAQGAYCDDVLWWHRDVLETVADRCSEPGAKLVFSGWPQSPQHPFKARWYDRITSGALTGAVHHFALADNPALSAEYLDELRERWIHIPHEYARRVMGQWATPGGLAIPSYDTAITTRRPRGVDPYLVVIGCDWGSAGTSCAIRVLCYPDGSMLADREWTRDHGREGHLDDTGQAGAIIRDLCRPAEVGTAKIVAFVDPSATGLINALVHAGIVAVPAVTDIDLGTRTINRRIGAGQLRIHTRCDRLIQDVGSLAYDEDALAEGREVIDKSTTTTPGAHHYDGLRYAVHSHATGVSTGGLTTAQQAAMAAADTARPHVRAPNTSRPDAA